MKAIPNEIFFYLREHFPDGSISDMNSVTSESGNLIFKIKVHENDLFHRLEFSEQGDLLLHNKEPVGESNYYF